METQTLSANISDNRIYKTGKLPDKSKLYIGARVMLTANINTSSRLMNGSVGKIEYTQIPRAGNDLVGIIYVKFYDVDAGNSLKNNLRNEMNEYVPITAIAKTFLHSHKNKTVPVQ